MKILQVVTQFEAAGAQQVALTLHHDLQRRGQSVQTVFLYYKRDELPPFEGISCLFPRKPGLLSAVRLLPELAMLLRRQRPDCVLAHTHYANVLASAIAWLGGIPKRIAVQHNLLHTYPKAARWLDSAMGTLGIYTEMVAVSPAVLESARSYPAAYRDRLQVIINGVEVPGVEGPRGDAERPSALSEVKDFAPEGYAVAVGRLSAQKNHRLLIEVAKRCPSLKLLIVGEGELRRELEELIRESRVGGQVRLLGSLPRPVVLELVRAAKLFLFPSLFEGIPLAILEAMALGVPVIASDLPELHEALAESGSYLDAHDAQSWASEVNRLLHAPAERAAMSARSMELSQRFSKEKMVQKYEEVLRRQ